MGYSNESIAPLALAAFRYGGNEAIIIVSVLTKMAWCSDPDIKIRTFSLISVNLDLSSFEIMSRVVSVRGFQKMANVTINST